MSVQGSNEWLRDRMGRVTASRIKSVMMAPTTKGYQEYRAELICERLTGESKDFFTGISMQHGTETEPQARAMYTLLTGNDVEEVGFIQHPTMEMAGASPDGLVGSDGGVEIKCPAPHTHIGTLSSGNIEKDYLLQVQWNMECTGRKWWDFVSFCPALPPELQMYKQRIEFDADKVKEITEAVTRFLADVDAMTETLTKLSQEAA